MQMVDVSASVDLSASNFGAVQKLGECVCHGRPAGCHAHSVPLVSSSSAISLQLFFTQWNKKNVCIYLDWRNLSTGEYLDAISQAL